MDKYNIILDPTKVKAQLLCNIGGVCRGCGADKAPESNLWFVTFRLINISVSTGFGFSPDKRKLQIKPLSTISCHVVTALFCFMQLSIIFS